MNWGNLKFSFTIPGCEDNSVKLASRWCCSTRPSSLVFYLLQFFFLFLDAHICVGFLKMLLQQDALFLYSFFTLSLLLGVYQINEVRSKQVKGRECCLLDTLPQLLLYFDPISVVMAPNRFTFFFWFLNFSVLNPEAWSYG